MNGPGSIVMVDAHVHVHPRADAAALLAAATRNFAAAAQRLNTGQWQGVLLLSEMTGVDWFESTFPVAGKATLGEWTLTAPSAEDISLKASASGATLIVVAGRQVVTSERIEVLALGSRSRIEDGQSLQATIAAAHSVRATVVLPWAVGKWLGHRGRLVSAVLQQARALEVFAGDNSGRPLFWPAARTFGLAVTQGRPLLPGTDPLPLEDQEQRVGSMGFWFQGQLPVDAPGRALQQRLIQGDPGRIRPYGRLESPWRFIRNQLALRLNRRAS